MGRDSGYYRLENCSQPGGHFTQNGMLNGIPKVKKLIVEFLLPYNLMASQREVQELFMNGKNALGMAKKGRRWRKFVRWYGGKYLLANGERLLSNDSPEEKFAPVITGNQEFEMNVICADLGGICKGRKGKE